MIKILFLAANPTDTLYLRLDEEFHRIAKALYQVEHCEILSLHRQQLVCSMDIHRALLDFKPEIIHFSGHGRPGEGIVLLDNKGKKNIVAPDTLAQIFASLQPLQCVVLNGCYSEAQAKAIAKHVDYLIGVRQGIGDKKAIEFSFVFYAALSKGKTIPFAYKLGCSAIHMAGISKDLTPILKVRNGKSHNGENNNQDRNFLRALMHLYTQSSSGIGKQGGYKVPHLLAHLLVNLLLPKRVSFRINPDKMELCGSYIFHQTLSDYLQFRRLEESEYIQDMTHIARWANIVEKIGGIFLQYAKLYHELSQNSLDKEDFDEYAMLSQEASNIENFFKQWNMHDVVHEEVTDDSLELEPMADDEEDMLTRELAQVANWLKHTDIEPVETDPEAQKIVEELANYLETTWRNHPKANREPQHPYREQKVEHFLNEPSECVTRWATLKDILIYINSSREPTLIPPTVNEQLEDREIELKELIECLHMLATIKCSNPTFDPTTTKTVLQRILLRFKQDFSIGCMDRFQTEPVTLVIGNHNRPVQRLVEKSIADPSSFFNPLIIYGGEGLGKTTLLKSIASMYSKQGLHVFYCPSDQFLEDVATAEEEPFAGLLLEIYKSADVFLFDDLRLLTKKKKAQKKLDDLIGYLVEHGRQVIVTSNMLPVHLDLEEHLIKQLELGVPIQVEEPNIDTKLNLLKSMMANANHSLSEDALKQIAEQSGSNIRELEGALKFISAQIELGEQTNVTSAFEKWKQGRLDTIPRKRRKQTPDAKLQPMLKMPD